MKNNIRPIVYKEGYQMKPKLRNKDFYINRSKIGGKQHYR